MSTTYYLVQSKSRHSKLIP